MIIFSVARLACRKLSGRAETGHQGASGRLGDLGKDGSKDLNADMPACVSGFAFLGSSSPAAIKPVRMWPLVWSLWRAPVVLVHRLIGRGQTKVREEDAEEGQCFIAGYTRPIATTGLVATAPNFQRALYGLLETKGLPVVEVNTAGARWLLE